MIYEGVKGLLLGILKAPGAPPDPPAGTPASVRVFRASPQFLTYNLVVVGIISAVLAIIPTIVAIILAFNSRAPLAGKIGCALAAVGAITVGAFSWFMTRLEYDMRYYIITDRSLRIRKGVWTITEATLTYANVQHLEISQGPIQQLLGISDLVVRTAGGGMVLPNADQLSQRLGHRGVLHGIDNAEEIRDIINGHLKRYRHAGLGDPEERHGHSSSKAALSPRAVERLREIRDELRAWRSRGDTRIQA